MSAVLNRVPPVDETAVEDTGVLRFVCAGSVDDGKSTLIGRLLHDSQAILADQLDAVARASRRRGAESVDLSLLTDGLEAEREQGITIDVAYRYFASPRRKFIIADTPGHEQYTRNMLTGASTAGAAVILVDARQGLLIQSKRHLYLAWLLGIRELVVAVNKMDLVEFDRKAFQAIREQVLAFGHRFDGVRFHFIPVAALHGDMVVHRGERLPWWSGPTLIELLESIDAEKANREQPLRVPVQIVARSHAVFDERRGYLGRIESGTVRAGDDIVVLPSGLRSRIREVLGLDGPQESAVSGDAVTLVLEDELDVSRGDLIASAAQPARTGNRISARLCWLGNEPLDFSRRYWLRQGTRSVRAQVRTVDRRVNIDTLEEEASDGTVHLNEIVHASLVLQQPIAFDAYTANRATGAFVLIDEVSHQTVAGGMID